MDINTIDPAAIATASGGGLLAGLTAFFRGWYKDHRLEERLERMNKKTDDLAEEIETNARLSLETFVHKRDFDTTVARVESRMDRQFEETRSLMVNIFKQQKD